MGSQMAILSQSDWSPTLCSENPAISPSENASKLKSMTETIGLFHLAQINIWLSELALTVCDPRVGLSYQNFFLLGKGKEISLIFQ